MDMSYDDWKTTPPDEEQDNEACGCKWVISHGVRFLIERCEEHEYLYQEEEKRRLAREALEPLVLRQDDDDNIPF